LNQFPDAEADRTVGRKHLLIVAGKPFGAAVYGAFLVLTYASIGVGIAAGYLPLAALLGLLTLVLAVPLFVGALKYAENIGKLMPYLGMNVLVNLATPTLVAVGLFVGR
jgi:1,4-dihydroxy-2-naphthoate octaprenyltransferase